MLLSDVFDIRTIKPVLKSTTKRGVFKELIEALRVVYPALDRDTSLRAIQDREHKLNTSIAPRVAVPHGYYLGIDGIVGALGFSETGIDYGAPDNQPVYGVFLLLMGDASREKHLGVLHEIMDLINSGGLERLQRAGSPEEIHRMLSLVF
jgi:mannitol/fructose-specific phosphotransferase system IIA component (Ntr-type)